MQWIVAPDPNEKCRGRLSGGGMNYVCVLGRSGVADNKREGDGATPVGEFPIRSVLFRADKLDPPRTALPHHPIGTADGWCDDPTDPAYNRPVTLPYPARCENLWRDDDVYDVVVILGHNDDPVVPGAGSAIFLHIAKPDETPTEGCVALKRDDVIALVARFAPGDTLIIQSPAAS